MIDFISFSSLPSSERTQAASIFLDQYFGTGPEDYLYEVDAATGQLTGQRVRIQPVEREKQRKISNIEIVNINSAKFSFALALNLIRSLEII